MKSKRNGGEYYYYKQAKGRSIYLGTADKPIQEAVLRAHKLFMKNKTRLEREEQVFKTLLAAIEKQKG